ncbi:MAG: FAD-dependent monooxygenase [Halieaceae bacterium]
MIAGGGMVGLAFAIALRHISDDFKVTVLEARLPPTGTPSPLDSRASALNLVSKGIFEAWGLWSSLATKLGVIRQIHVSNQQRFGSGLLQPADVGSEEDTLGFVIENHHLGRAFLERAQALDIELQAPVDVASLEREAPPRLILSTGDSLPADLVIVADGSHSPLREKLGIDVDIRRTGQRAVVANVLFSAAQQGIAWERFTPYGPLALLPLPDQSGSTGSRFNVVWSMSEEQAEAFEFSEGDEFCRGLQQAVGWRLGKVLAVGKRTGWTLDRVLAKEQVRSGFLLAGNAAHGLHPVAGQGLNLSVRDAWHLGTAFREQLTGTKALCVPAALQTFAARVRQDQQETIGATDLLSTLFSRRGPLLDLPRDIALASLDTLSPLRRYIARRGTGGRRLANNTLKVTS